MEMLTWAMIVGLFVVIICGVVAGGLAENGWCYYPLTTICLLAAYAIFIAIPWWLLLWTRLPWWLEVILATTWYHGYYQEPLDITLVIRRFGFVWAHGSNQQDIACQQMSAEEEGQ